MDWNKLENAFKMFLKTPLDVSYLNSRLPNQCHTNIQKLTMNCSKSKQNYAKLNQHPSLSKKIPITEHLSMSHR